MDIVIVLFIFYFIFVYLIFLTVFFRSSRSAKMVEKKPIWKDVMRQEGVDDMTLLTKINNDAIAQNLKERFDADVIYVLFLKLFRILLTNF